MAQFSFEDEKNIIEQLRQTQEELDNELDKQEGNLNDDKIMKLRFRQMLQSLYLQKFKH